MADLEAAARSARYVERVAYCLVGEAASDEAVSEARNVLRLAVGLRRMLERLITARSAGAPGAPIARKEE